MQDKSSDDHICVNTKVNTYEITNHTQKLKMKHPHKHTKTWHQLMKYRTKKNSNSSAFLFQGEKDFHTVETMFPEASGDLVCVKKT